jgi:hypothetical protein
MKYLLSVFIALGCLGADAATKKGTKIIKADQIKTLDIADNAYSLPLAVGRVSVFSWQAELVGLLVTDPNNPLRKVKATIDISMNGGAGEIDNTQAWERASFFYGTKKGLGDDGGGDRPIGKLVTVIYDPLLVEQTTVGCMGLDLEVADLPLTLGTKSCYKIRPTYIVEHPPL